MKRIYNQFSAAPYDNLAANRIREIMDHAIAQIWEECVEKKDYCPRDTESLCHSQLSCSFAENILKRAISVRRAKSS